MLKVVVPGIELYDEALEEFTSSEGFVLNLEHSLYSMSKWESKFEKPFLTKESKTVDEILSYIECMILNPDPPENVLRTLSQANLEEINRYIDAKHSATWFQDPPAKPGSREVVTSEVIYYWMISFNIPIECQHWHLNRLFTLIRIFTIKNSKSKKMNRSEVLARNRELNAQRKASLGTQG